ncbi:MAG: methionyl-tRNA formyltransferase [Patescibacteria group bacterium]
MKKMSNKVIFFGNERLATGARTTAPIFRALLDNNYSIQALIIAQNDFGKSRKYRAVEVDYLAETNNIPVFAPKNIGEEVEHIKSFGADIGVLVAYGKIIPQAVIDIFPLGIINIHPSLLPKHRGPTPIESILINSPYRGGVSIMKLTTKMDAGPIYAQKIVPLIGNETKRELTQELQLIGRDLLIENLPLIISGELTPTAQDDSLATYDHRLTKKDSIIDWNKSAQQIDREIRAYQDWPKAKAKLGNINVSIIEAKVEPSSTGLPGEINVIKDTETISVKTGEGSIHIKKLQPDGKNIMTSAEFIRGYGDKITKSSSD